MPTDAERTAAMERVLKLEIGALTRLEERAAKEVLEILKDGKREIAEILARTPSEFSEFHFTQLRSSINGVLKEVGDALGVRVSAHASEGFSLGAQLVDKAIAAGGINITALLPEVDTRTLLGIRTFLVDSLSDATLDIGRKLRTNFGLVLTGARSRDQAVKEAQKILQTTKTRASTITNTEVGRAYAIANNERKLMASAYVPGLKKQWRRSFKHDPRQAHVLADGQVVKVEEKFTVNGVKLRFPRDPEGPPSETINCGCLSLPFMEKWEVRNPTRQDFTARELELNPFKRDLAGALASAS